MPACAVTCLGIAFLAASAGLHDAASLTLPSAILLLLAVAVAALAASLYSTVNLPRRP